MKNNVKVLKLVTGEDVISELTQNQDGTYSLRFPRFKEFRSWSGNPDEKL